MVSTLVLIYFDRTWLRHTTKTNFITFQIVDQEKCSILGFYKRIWNYLFHYILCMVFQEKYSCYALLTDQMSLPDCLYFLRYWKFMYHNHLTVFLSWFLEFLSFSVFYKPFFYITKKSRQKC